ncbi:hypothetical protein BD410DRAFT_787824 [Rickenella mellea]|uniref:CoA-dependent acyltransferase n=1 Tax=Rickenella mellea TaxID=50990 RepID=A0A4Y7Q5S8_9AGAM|nr:hypothetical protein BD410DRAFT_787824 [Rickenella mellea]
MFRTSRCPSLANAIHAGVGVRSLIPRVYFSVGYPRPRPKAKVVRAGHELICHWLRRSAGQHGYNSSSVRIEHHNVPQPTMANTPTVTDTKPSSGNSPYKWRRDEMHLGSMRFKRQIVAGEVIQDVVNATKHGEGSIFLGVYATISSPLNHHELLAQLRRAWIALRWDVPTIAAQTVHDRKNIAKPRTWMTYDVAQSHTDVEKWAEETVTLRKDITDLDQLRYEVGQGPMPPADLVPQSFLYLAPSSSTAFGVLMNVSHIPFDGSGVKILMSKLFEHLAMYISDPHYAPLQSATMRWGREYGNLLPATVDILRKHEPAQIDVHGKVLVPATPEEPQSGPAYDETRTKIMNEAAKYAPHVHPFKTYIEPPYNLLTKPISRRVSHEFTIEESNKIISTVRAEQMTVNQLLLGAVCLLPIIDNPPADGPNSQAVVFVHGVVDCRQRLEKSYRHIDGYPGFCLSTSPIVVPVSTATSMPSSSKAEKVLALATIVREQYKAQAALPALLGVNAEIVEMKATNPNTLPWTGPMFLADGRGSKYLRESYPEHGPAQVIEITDFFTSVNKTEPGPAFRALEWKGRIMLSADYNELAVEPKVVEGWMKLWAELVLVVTNR